MPLSVAQVLALLFVIVLSAILGGIVANAKGRSAGVGVIVGLLFGPLGVLIIAVLPRGSSGSTLVLSKFAIAGRPLPTPHPTVEIVGREQGIVAFILTLMGLSPITRFTVTGTEVRSEKSSLFGQRSQFIPLGCVSTLLSGVEKPISAIVFAAVVIMFGTYISVEFGTWAAISIALVIAVALVVVYILRRDLFIEVHPDGGPPISLRFKPSVIEGVPIDVNRAVAAIGVIRDLVVLEASSWQILMDPDGEKRKQYTEQLRQKEEAEWAEAARLKQLQEAEEPKRRDAAIQRRKEQEEAAERRRKEAEEQERKARIERQNEEERLANSRATVNCPSCNRKVSITDLRPGNEYQCPHCKRGFKYS